MWETDLGYFGVPNGEQVKSRLEVANRPRLRLDLAGRVCMLLVVYVPCSTLTLERVYVYVFRQTMKRRGRGRPLDLECS
jgi:hypothetical protein